MTNLILLQDSYKISHNKQYPPGTQHIYSYLESRGGKFDHTVFFGLNYYLKKYLSVPVTMSDVDYAEERITKHMGEGIFNRSGWERIVNVHGGFLPIRIRAVPEGSRIPVHNVLMTLENTDPELPWVTNFIETLLLKVWYPTTVATLSNEIRRLILNHLVHTGDENGIDFKLHGFGYRGNSSEESAAIGDAAHLTSFKGTDTIAALEMLTEYYGEDMAGFSIPASEHSTITSWGELNEYEAYENMITKFGNRMFACVSDSYNIFDACEHIWGEQLKNKIIECGNRGGSLVIRFDSGNPCSVIPQCIESLGDKFGFTVNEKGYKVLPNYLRLIQGDGVNLDSINDILTALKEKGWSADNIAFGMGGALIQRVDRDTQKFAIKASSTIRNGKVYDVYKNPVTDPGKISKRGRLKLIETESGYQTVDEHVLGRDILQTVWEDGILQVDPTLEEIRTRVKETELVFA